MRRPLPTEPLIDVEEARARVLDRIEYLGASEASLEQARGDVLATAVSTRDPIPRFDNSAMDGYAVRSADVTGEVVLQVIGEAKAGDNPTIELRAGTALKIMTGAVLPPGADAVIEVEETTARAGKVTVHVPVDAGRNVRPAGDDVPAGTTVIQSGVEIGAGEAALLATLGETDVIVGERPRVAVLVTGDEVISPGEELAPGQIRDSNSIALRFLVEEAGGEVVLLERVPDTLEAHVAAFERAVAAEADLIVSSGGVAVGDYDFVKDAVEQLGSIELWRVAMQPGKPVVLGEVKDIPFLGLPGNPVSVHVSFEQFVRPAIRKMRGCRDLLRSTITARLTEPIEKRPGRLHFVRVRLSRDGEAWLATPTGPQGSHVQTSLVDCHGVARFGKEETRFDAGAEVTVEVWKLPGT